jgi:hypothetical protein
MSRRKGVTARRKTRRGRYTPPKSIRYMLFTDCPGCPVCDVLAASTDGVFVVREHVPRQAERPRRDGPGLSFDQTPSQER